MADPFVLQTATATIQSGQAISAQVDIGPKTLVGIIVPSTWTSAGITIQASADGGSTWGELQDTGGSAVGVANVAGGAQVFLGFDPTKLRGAWSLKIRSGTAAAPVNQVSAVALTLVLRDIF